MHTATNLPASSFLISALISAKPSLRSRLTVVALCGAAPFAISDKASVPMSPVYSLWMLLFDTPALSAPRLSTARFSFCAPSSITRTFAQLSGVICDCFGFCRASKRVLCPAFSLKCRVMFALFLVPSIFVLQSTQVTVLFALNSANAASELSSVWRIVTIPSGAVTS